MKKIFARVYLVVSGVATFTALTYLQAWVFLVPVAVILFLLSIGWALYVGVVE